jgi:hypothetical protein
MRFPSKGFTAFSLYFHQYGTNEPNWELLINYILFGLAAGGGFAIPSGPASAGWEPSLPPLRQPRLLP